MRCSIGVHQWTKVTLYPDGDKIDTCYDVRQCSRCGKTDWTFSFLKRQLFHLRSRRDGLPAKSWTPGIGILKASSQPQPPLVGLTKLRQLEYFQVIFEQDPGLQPEETGNP